MGTSQFVMDTGGHCFLCLSLGRKEASGKGEEDDYDCECDGVRETFSFRNICEYLNVSLKEALADAIADSSSCSLEDSELKGLLCSGCAQLWRSFSSHYLELEVIRMKLDNCLKLIQGRMMEAGERGTGRCLEEEFRREMLSRPEGLEQFGIVEGLRKRTLEQCTRKLAAANPKVTVEKIHPPPSKPIPLPIKTEPLDPCSWAVECDICHVEVLDLFSHLSSAHVESKGDLDLDLGDNSEVGHVEDLPPSPPDEAILSDSEPEIPNGMEVDLWDHQPHQADPLDPADKGLSSSSSKMKANRYPCDLCPREFVQKCSLDRHRRQLHFAKVLKTSEGASADLEGALEKVEKNVTVTEPKDPVDDNLLRSFNDESGRFICHICGKELSRRSFWGHYRSSHEQIRFECTICGKEFAHRPSFNRHHNSAHGGSGTSCHESYRKLRVQISEASGNGIT